MNRFEKVWDRTAMVMAVVIATPAYFAGWLAGLAKGAARKGFENGERSARDAT